jgi:hypothetical protein
MRLLILGIALLLWVAPVLAQTGEVPVPLPRPSAAPVEDGDETGAAAKAEEADAAQAEAPGRVIKIEIIGEKKPGVAPPAVDYRAKQADLQRQRLLEARRARRAQEERARRVGSAVRQSEPLRRAGSPSRDGARSPN